MYNENELPLAGMRSGGVKGFAKLGNAHVVGALAFEKDKVEGKAILLTDKGCIRIYDVRKTELTNRLGKPSNVFKSFKSDEHKLVYVKLLNSDLEFNMIRVLNNLKEIVEIKVDDYHLTPMDYYAHSSIQMPAKNRLEIPFVEGSDYIAKSIVSKAIISPEEPTKKENEIVGPSTEEIKEEKIEEEKGYTQISIFDDEDID